MKTIKIGGELESIATGNIVVSSDHVYDKNIKKNLDTINSDHKTSILTITSELATANSEISGIKTSIVDLETKHDKAMASIANKISTAYIFKGSVANVSNLPSGGTINTGDVYNVTSTGMNYAAIVESDGTVTWDALGTIYSNATTSNAGLMTAAQVNELAALRTETNALKLNHVNWTFTIDKTIAEVGTIQSVTLTCKAPGVDKVELYDVTGKRTVATVDGDTLTKTVTGIPDTTTYKMIAYIGTSNKENPTTRTITFVKKIMYGSAASPASFNTSTASTKLQLSPAGTYDVTVSQNNQMIIILVPTGMTINKATLSGFDFPLEAPTSAGGIASGYDIYVSSNTYDAGTYTIEIS